MKKFFSILLVSAFMFIFPVHTSLYAAEANRHSIEIENKIDPNGWLEGGKYYHFTGESGSNVTGKLFFTEEEKAWVSFEFYDKSGKLILKHYKYVYFNPKHLDWIGYDFDLSSLKGDYKIKIDTYGMGMSWLNY